MKRRIHMLLLLGAVLLALPVVSQAKEKKQEAVIWNENSMSSTNFQVYVNDKKEEGAYLRFQLYRTTGKKRVPLSYENFYSGFTTIRIEGKDYLYGQGEDIKPPYFDEKKGHHISTQRIADVEVTQILKLSADGMKLYYKVSNPGSPRTIGVRAMTDLMVGSDDKGQIFADGVVIEQEAIFAKKAMPQTLEIGFAEKESPLLLNTNDQSFELLTIANWETLYNNRWSYRPESPQPLTDTALAYTWDEVRVETGKDKEYEVVYETPEQIIIKPGEPGKPGETGKPGVTGKPGEKAADKKAARTGDSGELRSWLLLFLCTSAAMAGRAYRNRKGGIR